MAVDTGNEIWEMIGSATTNTTYGSVHKPTVDFKWLWSLAQQEALQRVANKKDGIYVLERDPELRAKRIAGAYAHLYFHSKDVSNGRLQMYWVALAAFVVKDIFMAFKYTREKLFSGGFVADTKDTLGQAYEHGERTYFALAKGNIWLFMDIYPWLWLVLQWGLNDDGTVNSAFIKAAAAARNSATFQDQSRQAIEWLPFGSQWSSSCKNFVNGDPVYAEMNALPIGTHEGAVDAYTIQANHLVRSCIPQEKPTPFRLPPSRHWINFQGGGSLLGAYHKEMLRFCNDGAAIGRLDKVKHFTVTADIQTAYGQFVAQAVTGDKKEKLKSQQKELLAIANHEQINVLQPVIYDDPKLKQTLDLNHMLGRYFSNAATPYIQLVFSSTDAGNDPTNIVRFDPPQGFMDWLKGPTQSLADQEQRMRYVNKIANAFNKKMSKELVYMEIQLATISGWRA